MTHAELRSLALAILAAFIAIILASCETTTRALPPYERPLAKGEFQNVRTTAYTHTEADHRQYSNRNALGGELHAAGPAIHRAENGDVGAAIGVGLEEQSDYQRVSNSGVALQPFSREETTNHDARDDDQRRDRDDARAETSRHGFKIAADWERGRRLVALADGNDVPVAFDRAGLSH